MHYVDNLVLIANASSGHFHLTVVDGVNDLPCEELMVIVSNFRDAGQADPLVIGKKLFPRSCWVY